jgi:hypothetical protein
MTRRTARLSRDNLGPPEAVALGKRLATAQTPEALFLPTLLPADQAVDQQPEHDRADHDVDPVALERENQAGDGHPCDRRGNQQEEPKLSDSAAAPEEVAMTETSEAPIA